MHDGYTQSVTKRLIDIDDELLADVQNAMGTATMKETVNTALRQALSAHKARQHLEHLRSLPDFDLSDPEVMEGAWRSWDS